VAVITIETFRSSGGDDALLAADRRVQTEFFYQQPGLARRTTARSGDGEWLVVTLWDSEASADAADRSRASSDAAVAFDALIDRTSLRSGRYQPRDE
jgi:hypothetical protein